MMLKFVLASRMLLVRP